MKRKEGKKQKKDWTHDARSTFNGFVWQQTDLISSSYHRFLLLWLCLCLICFLCVVAAIPSKYCTALLHLNQWLAVDASSKLYTHIIYKMDDHFLFSYLPRVQCTVYTHQKPFVLRLAIFATWTVTHVFNFICQKALRSERVVVVIVVVFMFYSA